ncbi:VCBS repeat-containing protein [Streptomyces sp. B-S-A6]|uniref:VCBS repeat-containing protein n=1 Tax=Streptomyces cavernicola TaxID=3043613 RepID=A0ABT6SKT2_9ACTN|nr:VCBS repeat-containing protein [Streptomyces sp. B-S-A6]MDI3407861.1 VCBS repeat-containing protein [Streptomyces sp. B-S-A6]
MLVAGCSGGTEPAPRAPAAAKKADAVPLLPVPRGKGSELAARGADFNGDGLRDLVLDDLVHDSHGDDAGIGIAYGTRGGLPDARARQLLDPAEQAAPTDGELPAAFDAAASCDLDGDGFTDLVVATDPPYDGIGRPPVPLQLLFGSPGGLTGKAVKLAIPGRARGGNEWSDQPVCGDFDGDGRADLVVHASNARISFLRGPFTKSGARRGAPRSGTLLDAPGTALRGPALDVNRDGRDDFVVRASGGTSRSGLVLGGPAGPTRTGARFPAGRELAFGRFGRGRGLDAAVAGERRIELRYDMGAAGAGRGSLDVRAAALSSGDLDGDGRTELVVGTGGLKGPYVFEGTRRSTVPRTKAEGTRDVVAVADFDGDGLDDLVLRTHRGETRDEVALFPGTKDGLAARPARTFSTTAFVPAARAADADSSDGDSGDGRTTEGTE